MTIPETNKLVITAGELAKRGEIFVWAQEHNPVPPTQGRKHAWIGYTNLDSFVRAERTRKGLWLTYSTCSTAASTDNHCAAPYLRPQRRDRKDVDVVFGVVAAEGRSGGDDGREHRFGVASDWIGRDLLTQALDVSDAVGYLSLAELYLQRCPAAVAKFDDGVDFQAIGVAIVAQRPRVSLRQASSVGAQVVNAQRLEEQAKGLPIGKDSFGTHPKRGGWNGRAGEVTFGFGSKARLSTYGRVPAVQTLYYIHSFKHFEVRSDGRCRGRAGVVTQGGVLSDSL